MQTYKVTEVEKSFMRIKDGVWKGKRMPSISHFYSLCQDGKIAVEIQCQ